MMSRRAKLWMSVMVFGVLAARAFADGNPVELINDEDGAMWAGKVLLNREIKRSGEFSFESFGKYPTETIVQEFIQVNSNESYTLSCFMRSLNAEQPASAYFGLRMYDKDKRPIVICNVGAKANSESVLAAPAASGDQHLLVKAVDGWLGGGHAAVAFAVLPDYADLPNFAISAGIKEITAVGDTLKVELKAPLKMDFPAGTAVRLHSPWGAPFYWVANGWLSGEWQEFKTVIKGMAVSGTPADQFWTGTCYVKPFFWFGNWDKIPKEGARLLVDDIHFTVNPTAAD